MRMTPAVILVGVLSLLAAIALTMVYWPYARQDRTPSEIFRARTAEEEAGRLIYIQNGCVYCHTQSIRAFDWDMGAERIAQAGDYIADRPIQLGSQRTGLDLSQAGGEHPDDWHIAHFINPRYTRPSSLMPPFEWLGMERIGTLTRYIQSLGLKAADRSPTPTPPRPPACSGATGSTSITASAATARSGTAWGRPSPGSIRPRSTSPP